MDIGKIIPVILVIIILIIGGFAFSIYNANNKLKEEKAKLEEENTRLFQDRKQLQEKATRLEKELVDLKSRKEEVEQELNKIQKEKDDLLSKYNELLKERDSLVEKLSAQQKVSVQERPTSEGVSVQVSGGQEEYWSDLVKAKAQLEAKVDNLNKELLDTKNKLAELDKTNKELEIKIDELSKEKERLSGEIEFKERTLSIMSRDLVSEREARRTAIEELNKLRSQNVSLKRELVLANKEKMQLTNNIKEVLERKDSLEKRMAEIDRILREKSITLEQLQEEFKTAVKGSTPFVSNKETTSVQLPPIVVKPQATATLKNLKGEVIAVNNEEKFIIVSIGEKNGAKVGMQLVVYRGDKQIATAEIIEIRNEISAADIKEVLSGYTINKGDIVMVK